MAFGPLPSSADESQALRQVLRLVLALAPSELPPEAWTHVLARADRERLVGLSWYRSASSIRRIAPPEITAAWRSRAAGIRLRSETQLSLLAEAVSALRGDSLSPVVVKGIPLAVYLYGDATVRSAGDIDLFLPQAQRDQGTAALLRLGWSSVTGEAPEEETFECVRDGQMHALEVHSLPLDDPLLWHLHMPIAATWLDVGSAQLPVFAGPYLPSYLAAHLAKHEAPPLLWLVDFYTLWQRLGANERIEAETAAGECGLSAHLAWARELASNLEKAAQGSHVSTHRLEAIRGQVGDVNRLLRLVRLSGSVRNAAKTVSGRLLPPGRHVPWREAPRAFLGRAAGWVYRRWLSSLVRHHAASADRLPALAVDDEQFAQLLGEALGRGLAIWIRARGDSMQPAIPPMAAVRIRALDDHTLRRDDVVLALLPHGQFVLHRLVRLSDDFVQLKGDSLARRDAVVRRAAVLGLCDQVEVDGRVWRIEDRPRDPVHLLTSALWGRTRAAFAVRAQ